jgi:hypothetical protein
MYSGVQMGNTLAKLRQDVEFATATAKERERTRAGARATVSLPLVAACVPFVHRVDQIYEFIHPALMHHCIRLKTGLHTVENIVRGRASGRYALMASPTQTLTYLQTRLPDALSFPSFLITGANPFVYIDNEIFDGNQPLVLSCKDRATVCPPRAYGDSMARVFSSRNICWNKDRSRPLTDALVASIDEQFFTLYERGVMVPEKNEQFGAPPKSEANIIRFSFHGRKTDRRAEGMIVRLVKGGETVNAIAHMGPYGQAVFRTPEGDIMTLEELASTLSKT